MPNNIVKTEVTILIAEDDDGHAELIREHLVDAGVSNPLLRFRDGQEVWDFLAEIGPGPKRKHHHAYLLLLDIRMPKMDGVEVLRKVKAHPALKTMPVIMLTTTDDPREVEACYQLGCSSYVTKPVDFLRFAEALKRLGLFVTIMQVAQINSDS
ncbi:MAG: response regulator [Chloroflexi bacterium]|nr:response regulator [Chloroflexota bacterium]